MAAPAVRVEGLDELRRNMRRVKDRELDAEMKAIHLEIAREIGRRASPDVPRVSGKLWQSVRAAGTKSDAIGRAGSKSVPYAAAIHWGTKSYAGRPFLQDAARDLERNLTARYERQVADMLDRVIGS